MPRLLKKKHGSLFERKVALLDDPSRLSALLHPVRWNILSLLSKRPLYPSLIAQELGVNEQNVYYHVHLLARAGLIEVVRKEERHGALAKYYGVTNYGYAIELPGGQDRLWRGPTGGVDDETLSFLVPLIRSGVFSGKIVVGSPDPHGPYQVRSRDGHAAVDLALVLGKYITEISHSHVVLDVDVAKDERLLRENLVLVGGVLTNQITMDMNQHFPVRFSTDHFPYREIVSDRTGERYSDDHCGIIVKAVNPHQPEKRIFVFAGIRYPGTRAALLAFSHFRDELAKKYRGEDTWGVVVRGLDLDGDGSIDSVDFLE